MIDFYSIFSELMKLSINFLSIFLAGMAQKWKSDFAEFLKLFRIDQESVARAREDTLWSSNMLPGSNFDILMVNLHFIMKMCFSKRRFPDAAI